MAEYLAPDVYVEETSFRAKSIEGVATSTCGFAGMTRFGPVMVDGGPTPVHPRLVTSFAEFERVFGGLEPLLLGGTERPNYTAHAARAFFANGGLRLYVARVYDQPAAATGPARPADAKTDATKDVKDAVEAEQKAWDVAKDIRARGVACHVSASDPAVKWVARWPGAAGDVLVDVQVTRSRDVAFKHGTTWQARGAKHGSLVEVLSGAPSPTARDDAPLDRGKLAFVTVDADGVQAFHGAALPTTPVLRLVDLRVTVVSAPDRVAVYDGLGVHPQHKRAVMKVLTHDDPADEDGAVWLDWTLPTAAAKVDAAILDLAVTLQRGLAAATSVAEGVPVRLAGGSDGKMISAATLTGTAANPDDPKPTGLGALAEVEDIAIVAAPDAGDFAGAELQAAGALIAHAEQCRYRIAIVDPPKDSSLTEVRSFRGRFDSTRAAIYWPWARVADPLQQSAQGAPPSEIALPPSGFIAGIYARSDTERGVGKAPANEVVRGITRIESVVDNGRQQVLNPEGINALRFFEGRGNRVWGARTMSSDPEWKYVNVRRQFIYYERSIDCATQWAVFEPNGPRLWGNVRRTIEDFLLDEWTRGALLGAKPEEAYFVRCDRTTMTQNDLDNGRLICLIGVAPVRPAEFVIFRIGQWTADSKLV